MNDIYSYPFDNIQDEVTWKCNKNGIFSTSSVYDFLTSGHSFSHIWKANIPHRIKIFMWLLENNAVLAKDNMIRRNWLGSPTCYFCSSAENMDHLFFLCPVAKVLWGWLGYMHGATNIPESLVQYKHWIKHWFRRACGVHFWCRCDLLGYLEKKK